MGNTYLPKLFEDGMQRLAQFRLFDLLVEIFDVNGLVWLLQASKGISLNEKNGTTRSVRDSNDRPSVLQKSGTTERWRYMQM